MRMFEQQEIIERVEPQKPIDVKELSIKRNLLMMVEREPAVYKAIEHWLFSFEGAMSKTTFQKQIERLSSDDSKALTQLAQAEGKRSIRPTPQQDAPTLQKPLIEQMLEDTFIAVTGKGFRKAIKEAITQLRECGDVYILQAEEFILQFKHYSDKGSSPEMIDKAIDCDFLVIVEMELPIHLEWHHQEALARIIRQRKKRGAPVITTWSKVNRYYGGFMREFKLYNIS